MGCRWEEGRQWWGVDRRRGEVGWGVDRRRDEVVVGCRQEEG